MVRRLVGTIRFIQQSNHGHWFLITVYRMGRFFGHSLNVIGGIPEVGVDCEFTPLPRREAKSLPRATEIICYNRTAAELARQREHQRRKLRRGNQNNERNSHAPH